LELSLGFGDLGVQHAQRSRSFLESAAKFAKTLPQFRAVHDGPTHLPAWALDKSRRSVSILSRQ
jgi:hypothetical protein